LRPTPTDIRYLTYYGITESEYKKILAFQGGVCAICERPPKKQRLAVDHDHKSGIIRGLLCPSCNKGLAYFRDLATRLQRAHLYLSHTPVFKALGWIPVGRVGRVTRKWKTKTEKRERLREVALRLQAEGFEVPKNIKKIVNSEK